MYLNWEEKSMYVIDSLKWYPVSKVVQYLHDLRRFIIDTPGKYGISYLPRLEDIAELLPTDLTVTGTTDNNGSLNIPASKEHRFPYEICYICEAIGDWSLKLDKLALAANIMVNPSRLERKYPDLETAGDLEHYAIVVINQLLHMLSDRESFVNQEIFEELYGLQWVDSEEEVKTGREECEEKLEKVQDDHIEQNNGLKNSFNESEHGNQKSHEITNNDTIGSNANKSDSNGSLTKSKDEESQ